MLYPIIGGSLLLIILLVFSFQRRKQQKKTTKENEQRKVFCNKIIESCLIKIKGFPNLSETDNIRKDVDSVLSRITAVQNIIQLSNYKVTNGDENELADCARLTNTLEAKFSIPRERKKKVKAPIEYKKHYKNGKLKVEGVLLFEQMDGVWKYYYENGKMKKEGAYKNNLRVGEWKFYHEYGFLTHSENYKGGRLDGHSKYYYGGALVEACNWKKGTLDGLSSTYYSDGSLKTEQNYEESTLIGDIKIYPIPNLETLNLKTHKTYHENGMEKEVGLCDDEGVKYGEWLYYYPNGKIMKNGPGQKKSGPQRVINSYRENNKIHTRVYADLFENVHGTCRSFYENGFLEEVGEMKGSVSEPGIHKIGEWKFFWESGNIKGICEFENDNQTGECLIFNNKGILISWGEFLNNEKVGDWKYYDDNGVPV